MKYLNFKSLKIRDLDIKKIVLNPIFLVSITIIVLLFAQGYAGGYGQVVDGELDVSFRRSLGVNMMMDYKKDDGAWSFGYFVPICVLGVAWVRRREWSDVVYKPANISGLAIMLFALVVYWMGYLGHQKYLGYFALQILVLGSIVWFAGWQCMKKLFWCWALFGMMWPWRLLIEKVSTSLQFLMAKVTTAFLNLTTEGAVQNGSAVLAKQKDYVNHVPISLDIDVACSGMRSLFALILIGLIFVNISFNKEWKRWLFIPFIPIIAIASNFVRMLMLYYGNLFFGAEFAIGKGEGEESAYHIISGLVVFCVALFLMILLSDVINKGKINFKKKHVRRVVK